MADTVTVKQGTFSFLKNTFNAQGIVMAIRVWQPATFYEVDVRLTDTGNMSSWHRPQKVFILVAPLTWREYTPAHWKNDKQICTLYIDAGHEGPGCTWVKKLATGDTFSYVRPTDAYYAPVKDTPAVFLGDQSAIGHFFALAQIAGSNMPVSGAVVMEQHNHQLQYQSRLPELALEPICVKTTTFDALKKWVLTQTFKANATFYLMGNKDLVKDVRRLLRERGINSGQIFAKGFW